MTTHVVRRVTPVHAGDRRKPEVIHITVAQLAQYIGEHVAQKSHRRFSRRPHPAGRQGRVGMMHVAYLCFICASPGSTASTHSYRMKYQDTKVFITTPDP
jgi:hypothetical protein